MSLTEKKCEPCEGDVPPLGLGKIDEFMTQIKDWALKNEHLHKIFEFPDFKNAMKFVNKVADLAEKEGHHPDITIHYNKIEFEIWTHAINGLSENDFILAAKIDELV